MPSETGLGRSAPKPKAHPAKAPIPIMLTRKPSLASPAPCVQPISILGLCCSKFSAFRPRSWSSFERMVAMESKNTEMVLWLRLWLRPDVESIQVLSRFV